MDRDQFQQWLTERSDALGGDLDTLDEAQLTDISDGLSSRFEALREKRQGDGLDDDEMAEFREQVWPNLQAVRGQQQNRQARRDEANSEIDAAFNEYDATASEPETEEGEQEGQETEGGDESTEETPEQVEQAVAASAKKTGKATAKTTAKPRVPEIGTTGGNGGGSKTAPSSSKLPIAITAAGDLGDYTAGERVNFSQAGEMISRKLHALRNVGGGNGEQVPVVRLQGQMPAERQLRRNRPDENTARLTQVAGQQALVASGGNCAPLAIDYSYGATGSTGRPIRDALPSFQAERGGIQYRRDVSPVTDTTSPSPFDATDHWTMDNDEAVIGGNSPLEDEPKTKGLWIVGCPPTETAEVEAITLQVEYSNVSARFDPETLQVHQEAALVAHDRHCENWLLQKLQSLSKTVQSTKVLGATLDFLVTLDRTQAYMRSRHRIPNNINLRGIFPFWVTHLVRADMARRMALSPTETLALTDEQVSGFLRTRGINPVWHLDGKATDTAAASPLPAIPAQQYTEIAQGASVPNFPERVDFLLHPEGCFTHLDGGTLDLGVVRDTRLISVNRYRTFSETWEGVALRGVEPLRVLAQVRPTGETSGAVAVAANA